MKISIENFKSISKVHNFEIKPMTILSGVNSAGKSSFVQLLLILKQTVELDSSKNPFLLEGDFYRARSFSDVISNKNIDKTLKFSFVFDKSEVEKHNVFSIFKTFKNYDCRIDVEYNATENNEAFVSLFSVIFSFEDGEKRYINLISNNDNTYAVNSNTGIFSQELFGQDLNITGINYSSFLPRDYKFIKEKVDELGDHKIKESKTFIELLNFDDIKILINSFLENISYLGPDRISPEDEYNISKNRISNVGRKGEYTAQIINEQAPDKFDFLKIIEKENGIEYIPVIEDLIEAVKYWMCDVFEVSKNIRSEKMNETYKIILTNHSDIETSIKHVGFGISQLLPIIVQGLIMPIGGTLIVEQPEIHLHPKLQSKLYDFLYSLTLQGKKVIVETHSSHFITRMRRRIAEDETNEMDDQIGLTFIEGNIFRNIELDDYGTMNYYPEDFIEESNAELRAIVKAQMKKRKKNAEF